MHNDAQHNTTYIRPVLGYLMSVYKPSLKRNIIMMERVQNYFTKQVFRRCYPDPGYPMTMPNPHYRNQRLGLQSLEERRNQYDAVLSFKIMKDLTKVNARELYRFKRTVARGARFKIELPRYRTMTRRTSFAVRTAYAYSRLPPAVQALKSVVSFKKALMTSRRE